MSNASPSTTGGIGVFALLGIVFVVLKLTGFIDWSWWLVTLPFWVGLALVLAGFVLWLLYVFVAMWWRDRPAKRRNK